MSESQLIYQIMQEIGKHGYVVRCNSGTIKLDSGKYFRAMPKGFTDIMAILPGGRVCFIEAKTEKGNLSPEQEAFIVKMQTLGCIAGAVRSIDEALRLCGIEKDLPMEGI